MIFIIIYIVQVRNFCATTTTTTPTPNYRSNRIEEWTKDDVQEWFATSDFKEFSSKFPLSGEALSKWTEAQFKSVIGDVQGITLYNAIKDLKGKHFI